YLHYRLVRITELLSETANQVDTFAEASVALGQAVHSWLESAPPVLDRVKEVQMPPRNPGSSRRLLLQHAQQQLQQGVPVQEVADYCGLSQDEVRLLSCLQDRQHSESA
ncbi:MAG: hypothetical protein AB8B93_17765, partial [Pseudomonadales bacterium]